MHTIDYNPRNPRIGFFVQAARELLPDFKFKIDQFSSIFYIRMTYEWSPEERNASGTTRNSRKRVNHQDIHSSYFTLVVVDDSSRVQAFRDRYDFAFSSRQFWNFSDEDIADICGGVLEKLKKQLNKHKNTIALAQDPEGVARAEKQHEIYEKYGTEESRLVKIAALLQKTPYEMDAARVAEEGVALRRANPSHPLEGRLKKLKKMAKAAKVWQPGIGL